MSGDNVLFRYAGSVEVDTAFLDFTGSQVAIFDSLRNVILVRGFAKISEIGFQPH